MRLKLWPGEERARSAAGGGRVEPGWIMGGAGRLFIVMGDIHDDIADGCFDLIETELTSSRLPSLVVLDLALVSGLSARALHRLESLREKLNRAGTTLRLYPLPIATPAPMTATTISAGGAAVGGGG